MCLKNIQDTFLYTRLEYPRKVLQEETDNRFSIYSFSRRILILQDGQRLRGQIKHVGADFFLMRKNDSS